MNIGRVRHKKEILGRKEWVRFPMLKLGGLLARVDTGARTSSLHAVNVKPFERDCEHWVRFDSLGREGLEARLWKRKDVRSSNGEVESRYFIKTKIRFNEGKSLYLKLSLTDRDAMTYPVLLGRRLLDGRFLVDSGSAFLMGEDIK